MNNQVIALAAALLLPGLAPTLFGWLSGLLATPVFCLVCLNGQKKGTLLIRNAVIIAAVIALLLKMVPSLFFSLTMVPLGFSFSKSYRSGRNAIQTGIRGTLVLIAAWLVFWSVYGAIQGTNPYQNLLNTIDSGFKQTYEYYRKSSELPADNIVQLELTINELRRIIPMVLPGLLGCTVLFTVWINLLLSSSLIARIRPEQTPWEKYSRWRLPDHLIWFLIAAGIILLLGSEELSRIGIGIFLATALLYMFQGLAVFIFLLDKWKIPSYLRVLIYIILILQSYGLIFLMIAGLADVWFNFRQARPTENTNGN